MSTSSSNQKKKFDVFVSFRGKDIRESFLSHLQEALRTKKVEMFDDNKFGRGKDIEPEILEAIERSKISVVIFSKNYADSPWCLDELVKILECRQKYKQIVLPVFFRVDPAEVGSQSGYYGKALAKLEKEYRGNKVQKWKNALSQATNISGWDSKSRNIRDESELVKEIVKDILGKLGIVVPDDTSMQEWEKGLEEHARQLMLHNQTIKRHLQQEQDYLQMVADHEKKTKEIENQRKRH